MPNVISWTESEVNVLIQTWAEVEAKYPFLRSPRGAVTLNSKTYALYSKRCPYVRSSTAINRMKNLLRIFVLFVHKFNEDCRHKGEQLWFDLRVKERRAAAPINLRALAETVNRKSYARLMTMERAQRWLAGEERQGEEQEHRTGSSFLSPLPQLDAVGVSNGDEFSLSSETSTPCTEQGGDKAESRATQRSSSSSCSPSSLFDDDSELSSSPSPGTAKAGGKMKKLELPAKLKHRDCYILLENVMKLQDEKMRKAIIKLRVGIAGEIERSSEMVLSIISNQFEDLDSSGDVAFVTKVLNMQKQQIQDRFDQFEEKEARQGAAHRALIG